MPGRRMARSTDERHGLGFAYGVRFARLGLDLRAQVRCHSREGERSHFVPMIARGLGTAPNPTQRVLELTLREQDGRRVESVDDVVGIAVGGFRDAHP